MATTKEVLFSRTGIRTLDEWEQALHDIREMLRHVVVDGCLQFYAHEGTGTYTANAYKVVKQTFDDGSVVRNVVVSEENEY
jgi:hypothetical protein